MLSAKIDRWMRASWMSFEIFLIGSIHLQTRIVKSEVIQKPRAIIHRMLPETLGAWRTSKDHRTLSYECAPQMTDWMVKRQPCADYPTGGSRIPKWIILDKLGKMKEWTNCELDDRQMFEIGQERWITASLKHGRWCFIVRKGRTLMAIWKAGKEEAESCWRKERVQGTAMAIIATRISRATLIGPPTDLRNCVGCSSSLFYSQGSLLMLTALS